LSAINSEFEDNLPYANKVESRTDIGKDNTKKLGRLKIITLIAENVGRPNSTIFLITSNITPTDKEIVVKADIAKSIGGKICPINHRSIKGIKYHGEIILFRVRFIKSD
tara:strand:+ start:212 stop:538 length:327 start_codon:yes stop_codon:yes gene_type:complete